MVCPCSIVLILPKNQFIWWQELVYTALIHSSGSHNEAQRWQVAFLSSDRGPSKVRTSSSSASTVHWDSVERNLIQIFCLLQDFWLFVGVMPHLYLPDEAVLPGVNCSFSVCNIFLFGISTISFCTRIYPKLSTLAATDEAVLPGVVQDL